jgi:competence protein ComEA
LLAPAPTTSPFTVYITGQVVRPGVYELPPGSRFEDAIEIAGGFLPDADINGINLAALLIDSSHIIIPSSKIQEEEFSGKVNINTATVVELDALPGIGPVYARNIVDYRQKNGLFTYIEDIQKVDGIGPALFEKIKDLITISD